MEHTCIASKSKKNKSSLTQNSWGKNYLQGKNSLLGNRIQLKQIKLRENHLGDDFSPAVTVTRRMIKIMQHRKHRQEPGSN